MKRFTKIFLSFLLTFITIFCYAIPLNILSSNWYNQYLPNLNNRPLSDITFIDSLLGFAVTGDQIPTNANYIIKTTNGGDKWFKLDSVYGDISRIIFINANTGFISGGSIFGGFIYKTTNSGINWKLLPASVFASHFDDMSILNHDTIFVVDDDGFYGGVYRTTNGGNNWEHLFGSPSYLPQKIYMFDRNMGFFSTGSQLELFRTSNGGFNWTKIGDEVGFSQITFINALTGWKAGNNLMKKSTDGGLSWINQPLPNPGGHIFYGMYAFSILNKDTIWGCGGIYAYPNNSTRAVLYRTINSGLNWNFQIPDTSIINFYSYNYICFNNNLVGWVYSASRGIHTINGGDTIFLSVSKINSEIPSNYKLFQNFPNPFNSMTNVKLQMLKHGFAEIKIFDMTGRLIEILIKQNLNTGGYVFNFNASDLTSGIYFYSLFVDGIRIDTKKLILIK